MYLNDKKIKPTLSGERSVVVDILTEAYKKKKGKIISRIYQRLQKWKRNNTGYDRAKWEKELNTFCILVFWRSMCSTQHSSTSSKRWTVFGLKNVFIAPQVRGKLSQSQEQC